MWNNSAPGLDYFSRPKWMPKDTISDESRPPAADPGSSYSRSSQTIQHPFRQQGYASSSPPLVQPISEYTRLLPPTATASVASQDDKPRISNPLVFLAIAGILFLGGIMEVVRRVVVMHLRAQREKGKKRLAESVELGIVATEEVAVVASGNEGRQPVARPERAVLGEPVDSDCGRSIRSLPAYEPEDPSPAPPYTAVYEGARRK